MTDKITAALDRATVALDASLKLLSECRAEMIQADYASRSKLAQAVADHVAGRDDDAAEKFSEFIVGNAAQNAPESPQDAQVTTDATADAPGSARAVLKRLSEDRPVIRDHAGFVRANYIRGSDGSTMDLTDGIVVRDRTGKVRVAITPDGKAADLPRPSLLSRLKVFFAGLRS